MSKLICLRDERLASGEDRRYKGAHSTNKNDLFLSIADGDFAFANSIKEAVIDEVSTGNLSYSFLENKNATTIIGYYKVMYGLNIKPNEILFGNGVLYWIQVAIHALTHPGDGIIITNPVYDPFATIINETNRKVVDVPLIFENQKFHIDWEALDKAMEKSKLFILCSPHNPTGNVWKGSDLKRILEMARKNMVYVISDEIWQDIVISGEFCSILKFEEYQNIIIHTSSPAKTFNMGAMQFGIAIIKDKKLRDQVSIAAENSIHYSSSQPWVSRAIRTAYSSKDAHNWYLDYLKQIKSNIEIVTKIFDKYNIEYSYPESTYLIFAKLGSDNSYGQMLDDELKEAGLHVGMGYMYGKKYEKWVRINIAICDNSMRLLIDKLETICSKRDKINK